MAQWHQEKGGPSFISDPAETTPRGRHAAVQPKIPNPNTPDISETDFSEPLDKNLFMRDPETGSLMINEARLNEVQARVLRLVGFAGAVGLLGAVHLAVYNEIAKLLR